MWRRYRFKTKNLVDYRPLVFNPKFPWWCSGETSDAAIIIAYLPPNEPLEKYWYDAYDIEYTEEDRIIFSSRFSRPDYFEE